MSIDVIDGDLLDVDAIVNAVVGERRLDDRGAPRPVLEHRVRPA